MNLKALVGGAVLALAQSGGVYAATYDPATDFASGWTSATNPNATWSYGYSATLSGPVVLYTGRVTGPDSPNELFWISPLNNCCAASPAVGINNGPAFNDGNVALDADQIDLVASVSQNLVTDLVFTAPSSGTYSLTSAFIGAQYGIGVSVAVLKNASLLFSSSVTAFGQVAPFDASLSLWRRATRLRSQWCRAPVCKIQPLMSVSRPRGRFPSLQLGRCSLLASRVSALPPIAAHEASVFDNAPSGVSNMAGAAAKNAPLVLAWILALTGPLPANARGQKVALANGQILSFGDRGGIKPRHSTSIMQRERGPGSVAWHILAGTPAIIWDPGDKEIVASWTRSNAGQVVINKWMTKGDTHGRVFYNADVVLKDYFGLSSR